MPGLCVARRRGESPADRLAALCGRAFPGYPAPVIRTIGDGREMTLLVAVYPVPAVQPLGFPTPGCGT